MQGNYKERNPLLQECPFTRLLLATWRMICNITPTDMKTVILLCTLLWITSSTPGPQLDRGEAKAAFLLLNKIRSHPKAYSNTFQQFDDVLPKPPLKWNDTLARVAEAKALDMASRNYFESCNAGGLSGEEAIRMLIIDEGVPTLDHRKHLLGMDSWSHSLVDIGIGYARSNGHTRFRTYTCVIIAKHP
jgi:hypothetical protein